MHGARGVLPTCWSQSGATLTFLRPALVGLLACPAGAWAGSVSTTVEVQVRVEQVWALPPALPGRVGVEPAGSPASIGAAATTPVEPRGGWLRFDAPRARDLDGVETILVTTIF